MTSAAEDHSESVHAWRAAICAYLDLGWHLIPIPAIDGKPSKGPSGPDAVGWQKTPIHLRSDKRIEWFANNEKMNVGLLHSASGTCALDLDNQARSIEMLAACDVDLEELMNAGDAVAIDSHRPGRWKLLYRVPAGIELKTHRFKAPSDESGDPESIFELRAGDSQDVLPPSIHPETGLPYTWEGDWRDLPMLPQALLELWLSWPKTKRMLDLYVSGPDGPIHEADQTQAHSAGAAPGQVKGAELIALYNRQNSLDDILTRNGYARAGGRPDRYLRPGSHSGAPSVTVLPNTEPPAVFCHSTSDALSDEKPHDAFDCMRILECGGDYAAAFEQAERACMIEGQSVDERNRAKWEDTRNGDGAQQHTDRRNDESAEATKAPGKTPQAEVLLEIVDSTCEVWRDTSGQPFATVPYGEARAHVRLRGSGLQSWLARAYNQRRGGVPCREAVTGALAVLEGRALYGPHEHVTHLRTARAGARVYLDLGDATWRAIEIDAAGWRVVTSDAVPVRFRRSAGMQPLPQPVPGGELAELRELAPLVDDDAYVLVVGWLLAAFRPGGPYPILPLVAEQGSGKTTLARMIRRLIDPHAAELRSTIREPRDLAVAADNSHVIALDNLSSIPVWLSDALCCLSTGGGFATRSLFKDRDEEIFEAVRPLILTGISDVATRGDLLDRAVTVSLPRLPLQRPEAELWAAYEEARPRLLGAVLDAVSAALAHESVTPAPRGLRMVDAARWVAAAERGGAVPWGTGEHEAAIRRSRAAGHEIAIDASAIGPHLVGLIDAAGDRGWEGTPSELLAVLDDRLGEHGRKPQGWPKRACDLSAEINRLGPALRAMGYVVERDRRARSRTIRLRREGQPK